VSIGERRVLFILGTGITSGCLVLVYAGSWLQGAFTPWQRLPAFAEPVHRIVGADVGIVYVESESGILWACVTFVDDQCWIEPETVSLHPETIVEPCRWTSTPMSPTTRPPANRLDCITVAVHYADGFGRAAYALTSDGTVWGWENIYAAMEYVYLVIGPAVACGGGMLISFSIVVVQAVRGTLRYRRRFRHRR